MRLVVNLLAFAGKNVHTLISVWEVSGCWWLSLSKEKQSRDVLHQKPCDYHGCWQIFMVTVICMNARNLYANTRWAVVKFEKVCCKLEPETVRLQVKVKKLKSESFALLLKSNLQFLFKGRQFNFQATARTRRHFWCSPVCLFATNFTLQQPLAKQSENSLFSLVTGGCQANWSLGLPH